jgi:hypothetical protein
MLSNIIKIKISIKGLYVMFMLQGFLFDAYSLVVVNIDLAKS